MTTKLACDPAEIRRAVTLLCEPGRVYELRLLGTPKGTVSGYYDNLDSLATDAAKWSDNVGAEGTYVTINPCRPELLARASNRARGFAKHTTGDADIIGRRWLPIDCDPVRAAGISSTDAEHDAALAFAREIRTFLQQEYRMPSGILADSGNGAHVLQRIELTNDADAAALLKRVLEALAFRFDDDCVHVDVATFNAARIWKLYGTPARKGDSTADRPHRLARIIEAPE
jgi:hypothetical protein